MAHLRANFFQIAVIVFLCGYGFADCGPLPKMGPFLSYAIQPKLEDGTVFLEVTFSLRLNGTTAAILLPSEWQGQTELYRAIRNL